MSNQHDSKFLDDPEFQSLLVACLESLQRGESINRDALARDFPKYALDVEQFLEDRQLLEQVASEFGDVEPSQIAISVDEKSSARSDDYSVGDTIRYIGEYEILEEVARGGMGYRRFRLFPRRYRQGEQSGRLANGARDSSDSRL